MRTNFNLVVTNSNVIGFGQDRVVSSLKATYAPAAQHLAVWHASKRARESARAMKRRGSGTAAMAGAVLWAKQICLAVMGPTRLPVRRNGGTAAGQAWYDSVFLRVVIRRGFAGSVGAMFTQ